MPSRNSINKPRLTARKSHATPKKGTKLIGDSSLTTKDAGKVTTQRTISKKRAKKNVRNAKYKADYLKATAPELFGEEMMEDAESNTQRKKRLRKEALLNLLLSADDDIEEMEYTSSGKGTTLGGPPPTFD
jgi:hypothetical protein